MKGSEMKRRIVELKRRNGVKTSMIARALMELYNNYFDFDGRYNLSEKAKGVIV